MSAKENKAVVRRYIEECWNDHDLVNIDELVSPDYLNHAASPKHQHGIAAVKHVMYWLFAVFPDHRFDSRTPLRTGTR
jgi:hypothetical protein